MNVGVQSHPGEREKKSCESISYEEGGRYFSEIHDALSDVNSFDGRDVSFLPYMAQYWGTRSFTNGSMH
jgi:hypothetical protein